MTAGFVVVDESIEVLEESAEDEGEDDSPAEALAGLDVEVRLDVDFESL